MKVLKRIYYTFEFLLFYLYKLVQSNIIIAWDILTPKLYTNPAFIEVPLILKSNLGLLMFSNLLSMTPGTLSIDISEDKKTMLIHAMYYSSDELMQKDFKKLQHKIERITE